LGYNGSRSSNSFCAGGVEPSGSNIITLDLEMDKQLFCTLLPVGAVYTSMYVWQEEAQVSSANF
jgi:hypothetical protein